MGKVKEKDCLEDLRVDGWIIIRWTLSNRLEKHGMDSSGSENEQVMEFVNADLNVWIR